MTEKNWVTSHYDEIGNTTANFDSCFDLRYLYNKLTVFIPERGRSSPRSNLIIVLLRQIVVL